MHLRREVLARAQRRSDCLSRQRKTERTSRSVTINSTRWAHLHSNLAFRQTEGLAKTDQKTTITGASTRNWSRKSARNGYIRRTVKIPLLNGNRTEVPSTLLLKMTSMLSMILLGIFSIRLDLTRKAQKTHLRLWTP